MILTNGAGLFEIARVQHMQLLVAHHDQAVSVRGPFERGITIDGSAGELLAANAIPDVDLYFWIERRNLVGRLAIARDGLRRRDRNNGGRERGHAPSIR